MANAHHWFSEYQSPVVKVYEQESNKYVYQGLMYTLI